MVESLLKAVAADSVKRQSVKAAAQPPAPVKPVLVAGSTVTTLGFKHVQTFTGLLSDGVAAARKLIEDGRLDRYDADAMRDKAASIAFDLVAGLPVADRKRLAGSRRGCDDLAEDLRWEIEDAILSED